MRILAALAARRLRRYRLGMVVVLLSGLFAADPSVILIEGSSARTSEILAGDAPRDIRLLKLRAEVTRVADWATMARRSAGTEWQDMNEEERQRFVDAFTELLINNHLSNLENMEAGPTPEIRAGETEGSEERWVEMVIPHRFFPITVGFLVRNSSRGARLASPKTNGPKIVDVRVPGFRLTEHFQETLRVSVQRWGRAGTLARLEQKAAAAQRRLQSP
ncbi:MAG: ABC transporter substrate-binding protein [Myxococcota bacterium]